VADNRYFWIANNFLHDMATGTWAACVLVVWLLAGRRSGIPPEAAAALLDAMRLVFQLALVALIVIGATGGVRLAYWRRQTDPSELAQKRRALLVKHAAFAAVYGCGTVWLWSLIR
jgi:putative copper export protein